MSAIVTGHWSISSAAAGSSLLDDLISFWKLEETDAATRNDEVGSNDLSPNSTCVQQIGKIGNCTEFFSVNNSWLGCASNSSLQTGDISFTAAAWVKPYVNAARLIVGKGSGANIPGIEWGIAQDAGGKFAFNVWQTGTPQTILSDTFGIPATSTWHLVVVWVDKVANTVNIQIDNGAVDSATKTATPVAGSGGFSIGNYYDGTLTAAAFDGCVDAVGFWKRVLTVDERAALFTGGRTETVEDRTVTVSGVDALILIPGGCGLEYPFVTPRPFDLIIYHGGVGEDEQALLTDALKTNTRLALRDQGYLLAGINANGGVENWGNQAGLDDYAALYTYCNSNFTLGRVLFWSQSMGGLSGLLSLAAGTIPSVDGWYGIYPSCDLADMYSAHSNIFRPAIRTAYGIAVDDSDYATQTAGHDPMLKPATDFPAIRYRYTASASDTYVSKAANSDAFASKMSGRAIENTVVACSGEHGDASHFIPKDVTDFFGRC